MGMTIVINRNELQKGQRKTMKEEVGEMERDRDIVRARASISILMGNT